MEIGLFLLLPAPDTASDHEVVEQALWEVDMAEAGGFGSVWLAEHHLSSFGLVSAPSVLAAAVAQRTERLRIGYAVAVLPLHHPVRLAEEISWVDQLSHGRVLVGLGAGFSPYELGAFGVRLEERHARLEEGEAILRGLFTEEPFSWSGRHWQVPPVALRPRPYRAGGPSLLRATSGGASLRAAARQGRPVLLGLAPLDRIAASVAAYREVRAAAGRSAEEIEREVGELRVLRRVSVAPTDEEALEEARHALAWEEATARRVHGGADTTPPVPADGEATARSVHGAADRTPPATAGAGAHLDGGCIGSPATVRRELLALRALGIRHVLAWVTFGDMPRAAARRSIELLCREVLPGLGVADL